MWVSQLPATWHSWKPRVRNYHAIVSYLKANHLRYRLFSGVICEGLTPGPRLRCLWPWHSLKYFLARNRKTRKLRVWSVKVLQGFWNSWRIHPFKHPPINDLCYLQALSSCFLLWFEAQCDLSQAGFAIKYGTWAALFVTTHISAPWSSETLPNKRQVSLNKVQIMVHRGPGSRQPSPACVGIFNHPIWGRIIRSNFLRPCSLAFIIFVTSKISLTTIFLCNKAYGITSNPSDFMAFRVAFMYYEFLNWQCLLDGNLQLLVEVLSCRNCCYGKKKKKLGILMFSEEGWGMVCKTYSETVCCWIMLLRCVLFSFCLLVPLPLLPVKRWVGSVCAWGCVCALWFPFPLSHFKILNPLIRMGFDHWGFSPRLRKGASYRFLGFWTIRAAERTSRFWSRNCICL